jgi:hypothetical protein
VKRFVTTAPVALVALLAIAALGAASASATEAENTVLCKSVVAKCPAGEVAPAGSWMTFALENTTLETGFGTVKCGQGALGAQSTAGSGNPLPLKSAGYISCYVPSYGNCSRSTMSENRTTLTALNSGISSLVVGSAQEPFTISVTCASALGTAECTYARPNGLSVLLLQDYSLKRETFSTNKLEMGKVSGNWMCGASLKMSLEAVNVTGNYAAKAA